MPEVAKGHVDDRPFARTVYALVARRFTGDLVLDQRGRTYRVGWSGGAVIAADSAAPGDSIGRIAVELRLLSPAQMGDVLRLQAQAPKSEIEIVTQVGGLNESQVARLVRAAFARRAMRIFALPGASFVLEEPGTLEAAPGSEPFDGRQIIYRGVRLHYDEQRLEREIAGLVGDGAFQLRPRAVNVLPAFGFTEGDKAFLKALRDAPHTVAEIRERIDDAEGRARALAIVYSLAASACLEVENAEAKPKPAPPPKAKPSEPAPPPKAKPKPAPPPKAKPSEPAPSADPELIALITDRLAKIDAGASHFEILGVNRGASANAIQSAYFDLAKRLHPDRLRAEGLAEPRAETVFAVVNQAFAVLSNPQKRAEYETRLDAGPDAPSDREAEEMALKALRAETAFQKGEIALGANSFAAARDAFAEAVELNPDEGEHHALYAWATWCASSDKDAVGKQVRSHIRKAMRLSPKCVPAYFYRGQIAKQTGQLETAQECFRKVLELDPDHRQADTELRLLAKQQEDDKKGGLFSRLKGR